MSLEWEQVTIACQDPVALGRWWRAALGWIIVDEDNEVVELQAEPGRLPGLLFLAVDRAKHEQNRLHIDVRPDDQEAEVDRLLKLGATRVDVGQGDVSWVVMADPEGNEFCVLAPSAKPTGS